MKRIEDILKEKLAGGQSAGDPEQDASLWARVQPAAAPAGVQPLTTPPPPAARGLSAFARGALFASGLAVGVALGVAMGLHYGRLTEPPASASQPVTPAPTLEPLPLTSPAPADITPVAASVAAQTPAAKAAATVQDPPVAGLSAFVSDDEVPDRALLPAVMHNEDPPALRLLMRRVLEREPGPIGFLMPMKLGALQDRRFVGVRAFGGALWSQFAYRDAALEPMNAHLFGDWGTVSGVAVDFEALGQTWSIGLGTEHLVHRLAFDRTWTETAVGPDGSVSTTVYRRQVRRYNHVKNLVLPVEWQKEWVRPRWTLGGAVGAQLMLRADARGHAFSADGDLVAYGDGDLPKFRLQGAPTARVYAGVHVAPAWRVDLSLGATAQGFRSAGSGQLGGEGLAAWRGRVMSYRIQAGLTRFILRSVRH